MDFKSWLMSKNIQKTIIIPWVLVLVWMCVIFALSAQTAKQSTQLSQSVSNSIIKSTEKANVITPEKNKAKQDKKSKEIEPKIREIAHASVYLILGFLALNAIRRSGYKGFRAFAYTYLLCMVFAWSDEIHQIFVSGREAEFGDLSLDFIGSLIGMAMLVVIEMGHRLIFSNKNRHR